VVGTQARPENTERIGRVVEVQAASALAADQSVLWKLADEGVQRPTAGTRRTINDAVEGERDPQTRLN